MAKPIPRRTLLRGSGVALALPMLEAMLPRKASAQTAESLPGRAVFMHYGIGMNMRQFYPEGFGPDCQLSRILRPLEKHKKNMTAFTGTWLETGGGHSGDYPFLTGAPGKTPSGIIQSISADQVIAEHVGQATRFPSLQLSIQRGTGYGGYMHTLSWNRQGIPLAAENEPQRVFKKLFSVETARERRDRDEAFRQRRSILDIVQGQAKKLQPRVSGNDREKLDEYFTSVREVEQQLQRNIDWSTKPKPNVELDGLGDYTRPMTSTSPGFDYSVYQKLMFDLVALAFQTDSTRVITYNIRTEGGEIFPVHDVSKQYHALTHHNNDPKNLDELAKVDEINMGFWAGLLDRLKSIQDADGRPLLDRTMLAYSSGMGIDHSRDRLPTAIFGGRALGMKHQTHLDLGNKPLSTVWHTMLDRMGIEMDTLQDSKGPIGELVG